MYVYTCIVLTVLIILKIYIWLQYIICKCFETTFIAFLSEIFSVLWISTLKQNWDILYLLHNCIILFLFIIFKFIYFSFCYLFLYFLAFVFLKKGLFLFQKRNAVLWGITIIFSFPLPFFLALPWNFLPLQGYFKDFFNLTLFSACFYLFI